MKYITILFTLIALSSHAGMGPPKPPMGPPPCWPPKKPCNIPIDGGVGFLIIAGAWLSYKKLRNMNKY